MTQDELKMWLLLMGFRQANIAGVMSYRDSHGSISITCSLLNPGDVNVSYRERQDTHSEWKGFRSPPQRAFDFLKKKLI